MSLRYALVLLLLNSGWASSFAQLEVTSGTTITIHDSTEISLEGSADTLITGSGSQVINNGTIIISPVSYLYEAPGSPITGSGTEQVTRVFNSPVNNIDLNGTGIFISLQSATDSLTVTRGHTDSLLSAGVTSVLRWYSMVPDTNSADPVISIKADTTELNGLSYGSLRAFSRINNSVNFLGGNFQSNVLQISSLDTIPSLLTLSGFYLNQLSDSINFCSVDTVLFEIEPSYALTDPVIFSFLDTSSNTIVTSDTVSVSGNTYTYTGNLPSGNYQLIFTSENPAFTDSSSFYLNIEEQPIASISSLPDSLCLNESNVPLSGLPLNGVFSGSGIANDTFLTAISPGMREIIYTYSTVHCTASATDSIYVKILPLVEIYPAGPVCDNSPALPLTGSPAGGSYAGTGIVSDEFSPSVGAGLWPVIYTYVDPLTNCSNSDTSSIEVLASPPAPTITQVLDTLSSTLSGGDLQWYFNGSLISGAESESYVVSSNGTYTVSITNADGCSSFSDPFDFTSIGIPENEELFLLIAPNPFDDHFRIVTKDGEFSYSITDISGRTIVSGFSENEATDVSSVNFAPGMYIVQVLHNNKMSTLRIVKR